MRKRKHGFLFIIVILFVMVSINIPEKTTPLTRQSANLTGRIGGEFSADKAYEHIVHLAEKLGPRPAGSKNEEKAAQYLYYMLEQYGWKVREQPFSKIVVNSHPLKPENKVQVINSQNIIAELPGAQPETILLGAHYDSADVSAPGAIDNASGVGVLLEIARNLAQEKQQKSYQIVFFGAEEYGLVGSSYFAQHSDLSAVQWVLNLDMVGTPLEIDIAGKLSSPPELIVQVVEIARQEQIPFHISRDFAVMAREGTQGGNSDFSPFLEQGIPAFGLGIAGRTDGYYHRPEDGIEQVTLQSLDTMGKFIHKLLASVELTGSGPRSWDNYYLPFQINSYVFFVPTFLQRLFFIIVIMLTIWFVARSVRDKEQILLKPGKDHLVMGLGVVGVAILTSLLSGGGEWLWQLVKGKEFLWQAYPEIFLAIRVLLAFCFLLVFLDLLRSLPGLKGVKLYWLVGVLCLTLLTVLLGLYRLDLAFPLVFWLLCYNLLIFLPNILLLLLGPYFIYKAHWELLNSQQWYSYYETVHSYPIVFILLYGLLFIPLILGALYILEKGRWPLHKLLRPLQLPALVTIVVLILTTGLVPNYSKLNPQNITVQKIWTESQEVVLKISSRDTLPTKMITELASQGLKVSEDRKALELKIPAEMAPLQAKATITDTGERLLNFRLTMTYDRDPYLVRITLESQKPFKIQEIDDFVPVGKLPRIFALEGKEKNNVYSLILERTPPHQSAIQWKIEADSILKCKLEAMFPDQAPTYKFELPNLSVDYQEIYQKVFEF